MFILKSERNNVDSLHLIIKRSCSYSLTVLLFESSILFVFRLSFKSKGVLAQLVERFNGIEEVSGSTPLHSTFPNLYFFSNNIYYSPFSVSSSGVRDSFIFGGNSTS